MPKKYYGEVLGKFFRNLLFILLVAVFILCSLLLILMVGNGIYLFFEKTALITVTILLVTVPPVWAALYYKARENFRKDALRVRIQDPEEDINTQSHEIVYMLPEDVIRQASTIVGIIPEDIQHIESKELRKKVIHAIMKHSPVEYGFTLITEYDPDLDFMLREIWDLNYTFKTRRKLMEKLRGCGVGLDGEFLKYLVD